MSLFRTTLKGFIYLNVLVLLLILVNTIPRDSIQENLVKTSEYMEGKEDRYYLFKDTPQSSVDTVTDCLGFNIIANIDSKNVIRSTLESCYYITDNSYSDDLSKTVNFNKAGNFSYIQYWHGYTIILRVLLLFTSYSNIKRIIALSFVLLLMLLLLIKPNVYKACFGVGLLICSVWFNFNTVCHTAPLLIALVGCLLIENKKSISWLNLFMYLGISTAFFDFLSNETLTLTLPLVFLIIRFNNENYKLKFTKFTKICISWLIGYTMTFAYKWSLCTFLIDSSYFELAVSRGFKEVYSDSSLTSGLALNVDMLFPFIKSSNTSFVLFIVLLTLLIISCYLFHREGCNKNNSITYLILISLIPYVRYLVLSNHSIYHYFFTYRAQLASLFCALVILNYTIDFKLIKKFIRME